MGVLQDKGRNKPRTLSEVQRPSPQRPTSGASLTSTPRTAVASATPPGRRTSPQSSVNSVNMENKSNEPKELPEASTKDKKSEDKNESENSLIDKFGNLSVNEGSDLNKMIENLSIKENKEDEEPSEDSDLVSRGPDRICTSVRTRPYVYEQQHLVSSDRYGGGTVLYPNNISTPQMACYSQTLHQGYLLQPANLQKPCEDKNSFTVENGLNDLPVTDINNELEKLLQCSDELPHLNAEDVNDVLPSAEEDNNDIHFPDSVINYIDKIICSNVDDKAIKSITEELGAMDKHQPPKTPDSAYDSDECSVGSPSSVASGASRSSATSGISGTSSVMSPDREIGVTMSTPYIRLATQPTNLQTQTVSGFPPVSNSPVIQRVQVQPGMVLVLPKPAVPSRVLPQLQPQPQQQLQLQAPSSTPPPSPQGLRHILPGINIPSAFDKCSEPAINRIRCIMIEQIKDRAWALMFSDPDSKFTEPDEDGNMLLSTVLINCKKIKNFMEVLYVLIQRLKVIINRNIEMASKLLATPNKTGHTPLDIACRFLRSTPQNALAVRYLADAMVEEGLAIGEEVDGNGNSLLHRLCLCGDEVQYIMAELLSMKDQMGKAVFDVNKKNSEGKTALHIAAQKHNDQMPCAILAQLLMRSGADISLKEGCAGNTVFHLVARESCDPNLLLTLLAPNTSYTNKIINQKNFNEDTPLHIVAANHSVPSDRQRLAVQHMIEYGADPKIQNKSRKAPLSLVPTERKQDIKNVLYHKRQVICQ